MRASAPVFEGCRIAVIIPAYREERLIVRTLGRLPAFVDRAFVVDDASDDATFSVAESHSDPRVSCLRHADNRGVGAAIATGYAAALADGADVLCVMAGDDQMDPADLSRVIAPVASGRADYVKGNRFRHPEARAMPLIRRFGSRVLSVATRLAAGIQVDDCQCGYTALGARAARLLPLDDLWPRYGYPNDLILMIAARGLTVTEVPVRPVYADEASGLRPWHLLSILGVIGRRALTERAVRERAQRVRLITSG